MCIPVIQQLREQGCEVVVLALTIAGEMAERNGISHKRPLDYVDLERVRPFGERLIDRHHTEGKGITRDESLAYLGVSLGNLCDEIGAEAAWDRYRLCGLNAFCPVSFMKNVLQTELPDLVVATTSPRMEKAAMRAAHDLNIPSLCMVDLFAILEFEWLSRPDNGEYLTVYSEKLRSKFIQAGRNENKIYVTGNPAFDALAPFKGLDTTDAFKRRKSIDESQKIIFFAEQPEPEDPELPRRIRGLLTDICARRDNWQLIVRLHPGTDPSKESIPTGAIQSHTDEPLYEALCAADVVVTLTSTVGMEALLLDRPTLILAVSPYQKFADYSEKDGALIVDDISKLEHGLTVLLSDSSVAAKLHNMRMTLPEVGQSTGKIVALINQILAGEMI